MRRGGRVGAGPLRLARMLPVLMIGTTVSACSSAAIGGAPAATGPNAKAPVAFALQTPAMPGYVEQSTTVVTPARLAQREGDPAIIAALQHQGFAGGASNQFADPGTTVPTVPFAVVISQALFFAAPSGAESYFAAEMRRQRQQSPPPSGSTSGLSVPGNETVDQLGGIQAGAPAGATGGVTVRSYFVLLRKGRVVASVSAYGDASVATAPAIAALVDAQEQVLQHSPD